MKTASLIKSAATGSVSLSGRLKIFLMVIAFIIIAVHAVVHAQSCAGIEPKGKRCRRPLRQVV